MILSTVRRSHVLRRFTSRCCQRPQLRTTSCWKTRNQPSILTAASWTSTELPKRARNVLRKDLTTASNDTSTVTTELSRLSFSVPVGIPAQFDALKRSLIQYYQGKDAARFSEWTPTIPAAKLASDGGSFWTAVFECPLTGEVFATGSLRSCAESLPAQNLHGVLHYSRRNAAQCAAAARALDCLQWREQPSSAEHRSCEELPYSRSPLQASKFMLPLAYPTWSSSETLLSWNENSNVTVDFLRAQYNLFFALDFDDRAFARSSVRSSEKQYAESRKSQLWTATFVAPDTGEAFPAGTLVGSSTYEAPSSWKVDGAVYYSGFKLARYAAAAHAIDCLSWRSYQEILEEYKGENSVPVGGSQEEAPSLATLSDRLLRLCHEEPFHSRPLIATEVYASVDKGVSTVVVEDAQTVVSAPASPPLPTGENENDAVVSSLPDAPGTSDHERTPLAAEESYRQDSPRPTKKPNRQPPKNLLHSFYQRFGEDVLLATSMRHRFASHFVLFDQELGIDHASTGETILEAEIDDLLTATLASLESPELAPEPVTLTASEATASSSIQSQFRDPSPPYWTAAFRCPLTEEVFLSGELRSSLPSTFIKVDGFVYYRQRKAAEHAAAARAYDSLMWRKRQGVDGQEMSTKHMEDDVSLLCAEEPYHSSEAPAFMLLQSSSSENSQNAASVKKPLHFLYSQFKCHHPHLDFTEGTFSVDYIDGSRYLLSSSTNSVSSPLYTAFFRSPLDGEVFLSGTLRDDRSEVRHIDGLVYYESLRSAERAAAARAVDCLSWREYHEADRMEAVRDRGGTTAGRCSDRVIRLCTEEPYSNDEFSEHTGIGGVVGTAKDPNQEKPLQDTGFLESQVDDGNVNEYHIEDLVAASDFGATGIDVDTAPNTLDRMAAAWASASGHSFVDDSTASEKKPVSAKSKEEWIDDPTDLNLLSAMEWYEWLDGRKGDDIVPTRPLGKNPVDSRVGTPTDQYRPLPSFSALNDALNALATYDREEAHDSAETRASPLFFEQTFDAPNVGALQMLEVALTSQQSTSRGDALTPNQHTTVGPRRVNTDTFNGFIKCLRREDEAATASAAEELLTKMEEGGSFMGHELPPPNVETFHAVMDCWLRVPSSQRGDNVQNLFERLKADTVGYRLKRSTFLRALYDLQRTEMLAHDVDAETSKFMKAERLISEMEELKSEYEDETLDPDTEILNAPLRWSGRRGCRQTGLTIPPLVCAWDDYELLFSAGFRSEEEPETKAALEEAVRTEQWFLDMEKHNTTKPNALPNIETYESVIQSWVRTGTSDGLHRAEAWANRAIEASTGTSNHHVVEGSMFPYSSGHVRPRLQTFHPVIAAWAFSGVEEAPRRVQEWVERLEELSSTMPDVRPDGRVKGALLLPWRRYVRSELAKASKSSESEFGYSVNRARLQENTEVSVGVPNDDGSLETLRNVFSMAKSMSKQLEEHVANLQRHKEAGKAQKEGMIHVASFGHVLGAWRDAGVLASKLRKSSDEGLTSDGAIDSVMETVKLLGDIIDSYQPIAQRPQNHEPDSEDKSSEMDKGDDVDFQQFSHLLHHYNLVYAAALSHLGDIVDSSKHNESDREGSSTPPASKDARNFPRMERMLRKSKELDHVRRASVPERRDEESPGMVACLSHLDWEQHEDGFAYEKDLFSSLDVDFGGITPLKGAPASIVGRKRLHHEVLKVCQRMASTNNYGDGVRVAMLLVDEIVLEVLHCIRSWPVHSMQQLPAEGYAVDDLTPEVMGILDTLAKLVPDTKERMSIIRQVQKASVDMAQSKGVSAHRPPLMESDKPTDEQMPIIVFVDVKAVKRYGF